MTPPVAKLEGTEALADARRKIAAADSALLDAVGALHAAALALPGARRALADLAGLTNKLSDDLNEAVVRPFDRAVLDELLYRSAEKGGAAGRRRST